MSLKIIGAGFGRTGTMSTYAALNQLGLRCYHMFEVIENKANKGHLEFWNDVANAPAGAPHDWNRVFAGYEAAVDNPAVCVWRELLAAYPDAKVLLTLHPKGAEAWYESTIDTIYFSMSSWQFHLLAWFTPFARKMRNMCNKLIWQRAHQGTMAERARALAFYAEHVERVKASVPAEKLLIYSVDQGWEPLCRFLGVPVPAAPFPNINDRAAIKKIIANITRGAYAIIALGVILLAALIYGLTRL
jgi:hypothetical protein